MTDDFFDLVEARRAVKDFDDSHEMPAEDLEKILTAAHHAPTAYNIQNYRFVVKQDKNERRHSAFMEACWNQPKASESSVLIILCADKDAWAKEPARYWESCPARRLWLTKHFKF